LARLRELSGGKPVGFKLCIGRPEEFVAIARAMVETGLHPDFVSVDGAEGGTGAAPLEFTNAVGMPLREGLIFVRNVLEGCNLRSKVKVIAAGKIATAFHMYRAIALGADACNSARGMMFAIGCIQSLRCNKNDCPVGVATQDRTLASALNVSSKSVRVFRYHQETIHAFVDLMSAVGRSSPAEIRASDIYRRVSPTRIERLDEVYEFIAPGSLVEGKAPEHLQRLWDASCSHSFGVEVPVPEMRKSA
jgi:glutamate synthase domain-containing protein 2